MISSAEQQKRIRKRYAAERRFKLYGVGALIAALLCLVVLLTDICSRGATAFFTTKLTVPVSFDTETLSLPESPTLADLENADYYTTLNKAVYSLFPDAVESSDKRAIKTLVSPLASMTLRQHLLENPDDLGKTIQVTVLAHSDVDQLVKGNVDRTLPEARRKLNDKQLGYVDLLQRQGTIFTTFNWRFFTSGDSRMPEMAGIGGAILGSLFTLLVTLLLSFPVAVAAAVYLEQFAPKNKWTALIEVNINNLAAVPSIVFGLLGLGIFLNYFEMPRSTPLVGGVVLGLRALPTIIVSARAALKAVPPSIKEGALAMGASEMQAIFHHVLPLALPGTLTGTIIALAQALGETAPLLMIGMVAFIVDIPTSPLDPSSVLPVQIFLWAESAEPGFVEKTSAAIMT
ncbi:MAG: phosphate ABC transporter permease PstA, partial [Bdellovibrionales bacterium]|nr:phosphate ABC transporter permease PstA [Bdellovibrionales bacterium]